MTISQHVDVTIMTRSMFSLPSLCAHAYLVTVLSASHLHGPAMNAFLKDVDLRRHIFLDVSLRLLAPTGRGRTLGSTS